MSGSKIIHVPHASTFIPELYRGTFLLDAESLEKEAYLSADLYTDQLARAAWPGATIIEAPVSRIVCDVERYADDDIETMAKVGRGMTYTHTHMGERMRREFSRAEREAIQQDLYEPHWAALRQAAEGSVLIDLHSYPEEVWPIEGDLAAHRPEIDLGTTEGVTPPEWTESLRRHFERAGYEVGINSPYAGVIDAGADAAVMIEIRRDILGKPGSEQWSRIVEALTAIPWPCVDG